MKFFTILLASIVAAHAATVVGTNYNLDGTGLSAPMTFVSTSNPSAQTNGMGVGKQLTIMPRPSGAYSATLIQGGYDAIVGPFRWSFVVPNTNAVLNMTDLVTNGVTFFTNLTTGGITFNGFSNGAVQVIVANVLTNTFANDLMVTNGGGLFTLRHFKNTNAADTSITNSLANAVLNVNGIQDNVTLAEGPNITITPSGHTLTIAANGGGGGSADYTPFHLFYDSGSGRFSITNESGDGTFTMLTSGAVEFHGALTSFAFADRALGRDFAWGFIANNGIFNIYNVHAGTVPVFIDQHGNTVIGGNNYGFGAIGSANLLDVRGDIGINGDPIDGTGNLTPDGSTTVLGSSTSFTTELSPGDVIISLFDSSYGKVVSIIDDATLTTDLPLGDSGGGGYSFTIIKNRLTIGPNGYPTTVNSEHTALHGQPYIVSAQSVTAKTNSTFKFITAPEDGYYRITFLGNITRAATSSSTLGPVWVSYYDARDAASKHQTNTAFSTSLNLTNISTSAAISVYCKGGSNLIANIDEASSGGTSMMFNCDFIFEKF